MSAISLAGFGRESTVARGVIQRWGVSAPRDTRHSPRLDRFASSNVATLTSSPTPKASTVPIDGRARGFHASVVFAFDEICSRTLARSEHDEHFSASWSQWHANFLKRICRAVDLNSLFTGRRLQRSSGETGSFEPPQGATLIRL